MRCLKGPYSTILQGTVKGARRRERQKKRWEDNIKEWTGMGFGDTLRAAEDREGWKGIVATSSVVPRRPPSLRDWDEMRWTPKLYKQQLWFLCLPRRLLLLNKCIKFHQDLLNCFQDVLPKRFCRKLLFYKVQRDITKTYKEELLFLCSARCLMIFIWSFIKISWMVFTL